MNVKLLTNLPFEPDKADLIQRLRLDEELLEEFEDIWQEAMAVAHPRVLYGCVPVTHSGDNAVLAGDIRFVSKVLYINMKDVTAAFPYVATCGRELHDLAQQKNDPLERYWVESIAEAVLRTGLDGALRIIEECEHTGTLYAMNPGSLPDWPISQQRPLFTLLGDVMNQIGVELTDSFLMIPVKSVSGLMFESEEHYTNCSLCPREGCVGRREPFDPILFNKKYHLDEG